MRPSRFVKSVFRYSRIVIGCFCMFLAGCANSETNTAALPPIVTFSLPTMYQGPSMGYVTAYAVTKSYPDEALADIATVDA